MIQSQLKLRLTQGQEQLVTDWMWILTGVYNWAVRKLEQDAKDGIFYSKQNFQNLLSLHGKKIGVPSHTLQGILRVVFTAWERCFKTLGGKPRLKGNRNKLNSIPFPDPIRAPNGNSLKLPGLGTLRFHKQSLPEGKIKGGRLMKRASGWYLCLFIEALPKAIPPKNDLKVGIDPGFYHLITLSTGEKKEHPREWEQT